MNDIANGAFYQIIYSAIQNTVSYDRYQQISSHLRMDNLNRTVQPVKPSDIACREEKIKYVYRESFSDLCMVRLLNMSAIEYLRCILWNEACSTTQEVRTYIHSKDKEMMVCRIVAVLSVIADIENGYNPKELAKFINTQRRHLIDTDIVEIGFECLIEKLSGIIQPKESFPTAEIKQQPTLTLPINSLMLIIYLRECDNHLRLRMRDNENVDKIRQLYDTIVRDPIAQTSHQVYHEFVRAYVDESYTIAQNIIDS